MLRDSNQGLSWDGTEDCSVDLCIVCRSVYHSARVISPSSWDSLHSWLLPTHCTLLKVFGLAVFHDKLPRTMKWISCSNCTCSQTPLSIYCPWNSTLLWLFALHENCKVKQNVLVVRPQGRTIKLANIRHCTHSGASISEIFPYNSPSSGFANAHYR